MVVNNRIINSLSNFGLTNYEAKAYCSLLAKNPLTAYAVAKESLIPTSKVYEVLSRLLEKEMIVEIFENKKKFIPVDPEILLSKFRTSTNRFIEYLSNALGLLKKKEDSSYIWNIKDYNYLINNAVKIIQNAKKELLISIWKEEMEILEKYLTDFKKKGRKLSIVHFGEPSVRFETMFHHPIENTIYSEKGGRPLVIVSVSKEVLWGNIYENERIDGAYSRNMGFVTLAEDYIKHDVYIMKIVKRFDKELIAKFGDNYKLLRDVFTDKEIL